MGNEQVKFDPSVWDAAGRASVARLEAAVLSKPHLIDAPNPQWMQKTPLHRAASCGRIASIEALVRLGSKAIDTPDCAGVTPIIDAASNGHAGAIEALVRLGSKAIDQPSIHGWTPMHSAAESGHTEVIEMLLRLGSQAIDHANRSGWTPLHYAARNMQVCAIEALVRFGSNALDVPNNDGMTPLCCTCDSLARRKEPVVQVLRALGANTNIPLELHQHLELVNSELPIELVLEVRRRVHFAHSLLYRLLFRLHSYCT